MSDRMKDFFPSGPMRPRPGLKRVDWGRKTFWVRLKMWWNGDPTQVHQLIEFNEHLFAATDRGLYWLAGDILKPVPFAVETNDE